MPIMLRLRGSGARRNNSRRGLGVPGRFLVLALLVASGGCSTADSDRAAPPDRPAPPRAPIRDEAPSVPRTAATSSASDTHPELAARNIDADLLQQLRSVTDRYGYGLGDGTILPDDMLTNFAFVALLTCDEIAAGETTWAQVIETDISDGAPPADARGFNDFLRNQFCSQVSPEPATAPTTPTTPPSADRPEPTPRCPDLDDLGPQISHKSEPAGDAAGVENLMTVEVTVTNPADFKLQLWIRMGSAAGAAAFYIDDSGQQNLGDYRWLPLGARQTDTFTFRATWIDGLPEPDPYIEYMNVDDANSLKTVRCRASESRA